MSFDDLKRQIKEYPISQILSLYVPLVEKGRDIKCCCPFHDDKNSRLVNGHVIVNDFSEDELEKIRHVILGIGCQGIVSRLYAKVYDMIEENKNIDGKSKAA